MADFADPVDGGLESVFAKLAEGPSEDDRRRGAMHRIATGMHLALQHLPEEAIALSFPVVAVTVTPAVAEMLSRAWGCNHDGKPEERDEIVAATGLVPLLDDAVRAVGGTAFAKLGTRSAKDGYDCDDDQRPNPVRSGAAAVGHLLDSFERVYLDLEDARLAGIDTAVVIRPFVRFPVDREYRLFVLDGEVVGISQMFYHRRHPDPARARAEDEPAVRGLAPRLVAAMAGHHRMVAVFDGTSAAVVQGGDGRGCRDFSADVAVLPDGRAALIEVNPSVTCGMVDPTLFREHPLDGSFRIVEGDAGDDPAEAPAYPLGDEVPNVEEEDHLPALALPDPFRKIA